MGKSSKQYLTSAENLTRAKYINIELPMDETPSTID